ncbi:MAG: hypothetical protein EBS77_01405 [Gammaproteobacteria bacterium]|nr:hypothetical protein [Gammaproteobacteria bacterium]
MWRISTVCGVLATTLLLMGCQPDELTLEVYTSDVELAKNEPIEVTATVSFSLLGEDQEGLLDQVSAMAIPYLSPDSEFSKSKATLGENLVIKTKIPMGTRAVLDTYLETNTRLLAIELEDETAYIRETAALQLFDESISRLNFMLGLEFPAKETQVNIISDSRDTKELLAIAVFVDRKPHLIFEKSLARRDSVSLIFKGGSDSVYSEVEPQWMLLP